MSAIGSGVEFTLNLATGPATAALTAFSELGKKIASGMSSDFTRAFRDAAGISTGGAPLTRGQVSGALAGGALQGGLQAFSRPGGGMGGIGIGAARGALDAAAKLPGGAGLVAMLGRAGFDRAAGPVENVLEMTEQGAMGVLGPAAQAGIRPDPAFRAAVVGFFNRQATLLQREMLQVRSQVTGLGMTAQTAWNLYR